MNPLDELVLSGDSKSIILLSFLQRIKKCRRGTTLHSPILQESLLFFYLYCGDATTASRKTSSDTIWSLIWLSQ
jgi:hypothetical protein